MMLFILLLVIKMSLGQRLRLLRKQRNLTQKAVCDALNISRSVYSQYELDEREPSLKRLIALSRFYMTSIDFLCGNTNRIKIDITDLNEFQQAKIYATLREITLTNLKNNIGIESEK